MIIQATQFMLPNGERRQITAEITDELDSEYDEMTKLGCRIELEILTTGEVSATISNDEADLDIRVTPNGPHVKAAVEEMLKEGKWRKAYEGSHEPSK